MQFVPEEIIDKAVEQVSATNDQAFLLQTLGEEQPAILGYLLSENFQLFSDQERDFVFFLCLVIWQAIKDTNPQVDQLNPESLDKAEEKNWEVLSAVKAKSFRERLDVFFENTTQEDLLAFIEDSLEQDEDSFISIESREFLFVSMKSIIDALATT